MRDDEFCAPWPYTFEGDGPHFVRFEMRGAPDVVAAGLFRALATAGEASGWTVERQNGSSLVVTTSEVHVRVLVQSGADSSTSVLPVVAPPLSSTEVAVIASCNAVARAARDSIISLVGEYCAGFSDEEVAAIVHSMPLLSTFSKHAHGALEHFALIYRDHFLEENLALLIGFERAGVDPHWVFALAKGDRTPQESNIRAHLKYRGYQVGVFDNAWFELSDPRCEERKADLETFINNARTAGKRIIMIDDGGLLANCWPEGQKILDCAVEVTIVGVRRLTALPELRIPVYDVAQSDVKLLITYPEIAESCVRRISELLGSEKLRGRSVLLVGYGTAGRDIAHRLRDRGCIVTVVDNDVLKLILAAENGFRSFRSVHAALRATQPFLVIGCTGDIAFDEEAFDAIPDGSFITGIATRDLDRLRFDVYDPIHLPRIGTLHRRHNRRFTQLGDGRSVNLFESEAIPNSANDVFKTAIFLATAHLASQFSRLRPGLHLQAVNDLIQESGLLDAYYELYLRDVEDHEETP